MKKNISLLTMICLAAGILCGLLLPQICQYVEFIGQIYINLLKFLIGPVIFTSIAVTAYNSAQRKNRLIIRSVIMFVVMFLATFVLASLIVFIIKPAEGFILEGLHYDSQPAKISLTEIIVNLFPSNLISMFAENKLFSIILFAYCFGYLANRVALGNKVIDLLQGTRDIMYQLLSYIMYITPVAVFSLICTSVSRYGAAVLGAGLKYIATAYIAGIMTILIVMVLPVWLIAGINPLVFVKKISRIWLITMTTCSSAATLPATMKLCREQLGIDESITDIVVPLGCTIHMCGGAVSFALLGLFCSKLYGIEVTAVQYLLMMASSVMINMSAPGIPNGGVVIGASYLQLLGIPLDFIGFYSGIYKILDMLYTTLNVTGDICANTLLSAMLKKAHKHL